ncbi:rod shape-determining protein MreC [Alcanivorax sp. JB21]|uniref:rod shape-determining protein MreC n=1 Tax=Alcanivorax limicola TaxID=2874102 RepID=UPI001CBDFEB9|nr:rod shape-determining protein MreC [Alcanivorax limicola]MBZ2189603.1 rod shape-determining protein MreC [Alcanivorax limicola]
MFADTPNPGYRLVLALVLGAALMLLDQRSDHVQPLRFAIGYLTAPVHYLAHVPSAMGQWASSQAVSRADLQSENNHLERQIMILQQRVQRLAVLEAENVRLRELLNSSAELDARVLAAEIIGIEPDPSRQEFVINKGGHAGVYRGQAVLDAGGLLGQVVDIGPLTARVLLITDASHALSVQVNRNGVRAILAGIGQPDRVRLLFVPDTADIIEGDLLVSTGLDQRFPRGYPVAEVIRVAHDPGAPFAIVEARPTANIDRASHVLLVERAAPRREREGGAQ